MLVAASVLISLSFLYWLVQFVNVFRVVRAMPMLARQPRDKEGAWPRVSVISTACNEGERIAAAMREKLTDDYPAAEFILVEDRSTDNTAEVADRLAAENARLKVVHVRDLPDGWLGKLNALARGTSAATGEWLLYSDADVHFRNSALRRAIAYAERRGLDHLAVLPEISYVNFLLDTFFSLFVRMLCLAGQVWRVEDPKSKTAVGCGSFNLVRRSAFERTPGFEALRMEVADDVALGRMLKGSGARQSVLNGRDCLSVALIRSLREGALSSERATWTEIGRFSLPRLLAFAVLFLLAELGAFLAFVPGLPLWVVILGLSGVAFGTAVSVISSVWANRRFLAALFWPLALVLEVYMMVRAGVLGAVRRGIWWRGTFYPNSALKAGKRY
jgi:cellulose synthase/poly-beta-1,6-N-acetylglucosamine synthase-like glycosyltransferase